MTQNWRDPQFVTRPDPDLVTAPYPLSLGFGDGVIYKLFHIDVRMKQLAKIKGSKRDLESIDIQKQKKIFLTVMLKIKLCGEER